MSGTFRRTPGHETDSVTKTITQASHGFVVGDAVYYSTTGSAYAKSKADAEATAECEGIVSAVDGNDFTLTLHGWISGLTGLTAGTQYISPSTAGALTATEPSTTGHVSKPVMFAVSSTGGYVNIMRGMVIAGSSVATHASSHEDGGSDEIDITALAGYVAPPSPSDTTPEVESGAGDSGESADYSRADHVHPAASSSGTIQRQEYTSGSGNFTASYTGIHFITMVGGGGGGSGGSRRNSSYYPCGGSGGGSAGAIIRLPLWLTNGTSYAYVIGAGGSGGSGATSDQTAGSNGTNGSSTTFMGMTAEYGRKGNVTSWSNSGDGGAGGAMIYSGAAVYAVGGLGGTGSSSGNGNNGSIRGLVNDGGFNPPYALEYAGAGGGSGASYDNSYGGYGGRFLQAATDNKGGSPSTYGGGGGGGATPFHRGGSGASGGTVASPPSNGSNGSYGSGGGGGGGGYNTNGSAGGAGGNGYILIEWWA